MKTAINIVRLVFLTAAFVAYARASYAADWQVVDCNTYCTGGTVRVFECTFYDSAGPSSSCTQWPCFFGDCCGTQHEYAYDPMYAVCDGYAVANGGSRPPWFTLTSCDESQLHYTTGYSCGDDWYVRASGSFYCSFDDYDCT